MLTPNKLARSGSESGEQQAFFAYCAVARLHGFAVADEWCDTSKINRTKSKALACLQWIHHIPNGGSRGDDAKSRKIRGARMKAEGVKKGVADVHLPWAITDAFSGVWHGLYIEMKKPSERPKTARGKGGMSDEQIQFREYCLANHFAFATCYDWIEAVNTLKSYIEVNHGK